MILLNFTRKAYVKEKCFANLVPAHPVTGPGLHVSAVSVAHAVYTVVSFVSTNLKGKSINIISRHEKDSNTLAGQIK